jgi:hypothetical protein
MPDYIAMQMISEYLLPGVLHYKKSLTKEKIAHLEKTYLKYSRDKCRVCVEPGRTTQIIQIGLSFLKMMNTYSIWGSR